MCDYEAAENNAMEVPQPTTQDADPECTCCSGYVQPPRAVSFKPIATYSRPTAPVESETIYRKSFYPIDATTMQHSRLGPIIHKDNIERPCAKLEDKTVNALSYMGHCGIKPPAPIIPMGRSLLGQGPMSSETTQRHDFVPKPGMRAPPIIPTGNIGRPCGESAKETTFRLSYMPIDVCQNPPPKAIRPFDEYHTPSAPAECNTIYKLSYVPVAPPCKEDYPWARKVSHSNPNAPVEKDTIYKLSYPGNCNMQKSEPIFPVSALKLFDGAASNSTIYRASYMPACGGRPDPIIPTPNIMPSCAPVEKDTVYKLSFMGHCGAVPPSPIIPGPSRLRNQGPMSSVTTQRNDFVPKPICRTVPFLPVDNSIQPLDTAEKCTIYKMSFSAPPCIERTQPIRPLNQTQRSTAPMECGTTQRLSYMPVAPSRREPTPWASRGSYQPPTGRMESDTIQRMSYRPPGVGCNPSCALHARQMNYGFPKAGIVN